MSLHSYLRCAAAGAALFIGLTYAGGAWAKPGDGPTKQGGVCEEDAITYCSELTPQRGSRHDCLRKNADKLSEACRSALDAGEARNQAKLENLRRFCAEDLDDFCSDERQKVPALRRCLKRHRNELSEGCLARVGGKTPSKAR